MSTRSLFTVACAGLLTAWSAAAQAEPASSTASAETPPSEAVVLFRQAQLLLDSGQTQLACDTFERSLQLQPGVGTKFNLADCWQRLGRTASAHKLFSDVVNQTRESGQTERSNIAQSRVDALAPKLSKVNLQVDPADTDLSVKLDGQPVPSEQLSSPLVMDPGQHELRGERAGYQPWTLPVSVPAGPVLVVLVAPKSAPLQPVPPSVAATPAPTPVAVASEPSPNTGDPARDRGTGSGGQALRYGLLGVGVIGVGVAAVMGAQFYDSNDNAKGVCPTSRNCSREEIDRHAQYIEDAKNARTWAWVGGGVGGAALLTATLLWISDSGSDDDEAAMQPWLNVSDNGVSASLSGRF